MDFTTRLHADWRGGGGGGGAKGWRQIARPQVHGHAIRCVATLPAPAPTDGDDDASTSSSIVGSTVFVSGADEKILRVFRSPGTFLGTLGESLPASASAARAAFARARAAAGDAAGAELPQLGLSNKAVDDANGRDGSTDEPSRDESSGGGGFDDDVVASVTPTVLAAPPTEETLAQATLWPETCKLYGHGDDLSCVAAHPSGKLIASACEARREGAADVWIWEASASGSGGGGGGGGGESGTTTTTTTSWRPAGRLPGATLTVVSLAFAPRGARDMLLAASRDRHVCVYVPARPGAAAYGAWGADGWRLARRAKAHAKAIYSAAWAPPPPASAESPDESVFATGARDRRVKLWVATAFDARGPNGASTGDADVAESPASSSIPAFDAAATAVAFAPPRSRDGGKRGRLTLAIGLEDGRVRVWSGGGFGDRDAPWTELCVVSACDGHAGAVRALAWRPVNRGRDDDDDLNGDADGDARGDGDGGGGGATLATVGADHSVRLFDLIGV
jgi:elongator complex protein 2